MLLDFSENYSVVQQNEIQQAHFRKTQISLFTGVAYSKDYMQSYLVVSDETDHSKYAVWTFEKAIFEHLKQERPMIEDIQLFTDGCAQQFKNIYTLSTLVYAQIDFGVSMEHHFQATSHGKGPHDGVGGSFKH